MDSKIEILIVDDEVSIRKLLSITLESESYKVLEATTGREGMLLAANHQPELIILDIGLPDLSGHEVLKKLRDWYNKAIIILSVVDTEADIVKALDNGATDYLTKPFRAFELLARIRSALRRYQLVENSQVLVFDGLRIDLVARSVFLNDQMLKLTSTEFNVLSLFARNEGRVLTHQYLLKELWGPGYQDQTQYLRVFVAALRKKIEQPSDKKHRIITENGIGYRFV